MSQGFYQGYKLGKGAVPLMCCSEGAMFFNDEEGVFMTSVGKVFDNIKNSGYAVIREM